MRLGVETPVEHVERTMQSLFRTLRSTQRTLLSAQLSSAANAQNVPKAPVKTLFVGNLPFVARPDELSALFEKFGTVASTRIVFNSQTGRSRGFGYVEMDEGAATTAMDKLNGFQFLGRELRVNEALPPKSAQRAPRRFDEDQGSSPRIITK